MNRMLTILNMGVYIGSRWYQGNGDVHFDIDVPCFLIENRMCDIHAVFCRCLLYQNLLKTQYVLQVTLFDVVYKLKHFDTKINLIDGI